VRGAGVSGGGRTELQREQVVRGEGLFGHGVSAMLVDVLLNEPSLVNVATPLGYHRLLGRLARD